MRIELFAIFGGMLFLFPTYGETQVKTQPVSPALIAEAFKDAETEYNEEIERRKTQQDSAKTQPQKNLNSPLEVRPELERLANQVEALRNQVIVEKTAALGTQTVRKVNVKGSKTTFSYRDDAIYEVNTAPERITDVQLKPGESLTSQPMAGDTVRWNVGIMKSGIGNQETTHVIIKPLDDDTETNLIIATDQHLYHLKLKSTDFHQPYVAWNYPQDSKEQKLELQKRKKFEEATSRPEDLNFKYDISGRSYDWKPIRVFDDGKKTFIQMKPELKVSEAPALFLVSEDGDQRLVNYRVKGDYYIVDRLFSEAVLRVGPEELVKIEKDSGKNFFERLFD